MGTVPMILMLAVGLATAGCGGNSPTPRVASAPSATAGGPMADPAEQAIRYANCLQRAGVTMMHPAEGPPQADKARTPLATLSRGMERCRQLAPVAEAPPNLSARDLAKRRAYAVCLRAHGVPEYPDPDPQTGEPAISEQAAAQLKNNPHFTRATEACRGNAPGTDAGSVTGG
jgi:hypothetical protein